IYCSLFFFFQAEDGIRDFHVTGVQTCALPICPSMGGALVLYTGTPIMEGRDLFREAVSEALRRFGGTFQYEEVDPDVFGEELERSEERRVGKECRARWSPYQ